MQFILGQKCDEIITVNEKTTFSMAVKDDVYVIFMRSGLKGDRGYLSSIMGYFKDKEKAKYVIHSIFDAITNGESYVVPKEEEIPELRIVSGHGVTTSRKRSHGRS